MIEKILKTSFVEDFIAKKIQLFILKNYKAFGNIHDVIRVRPFAPKLTKPKLQKTEFKNAVSNYLKFGNLDKVKEFRTISEAQEKEIIKLAKKESNE